MNKEIWSYIYAKYDGMSRNTYDANWGGRCNIYVINNISFKTYHDNVVDIFIDNKSLLDKYKGDFIKSLNLLDIERPVKIYMGNNENEKYLTIDYEKVNFYTNDALLLDNFRYKDKNIFEEILYLQPDFLKEEFEIMKENGIDLNYLFEEQKLNNKKFKNFIESNDNELIIKIADHYYKIYKEFHPELTETYSVCKTEILKNSYDNTINEYIASFTKDNLLLRTSEKEKYFDLEKLNKKEIYIDLQNEVSKKCYDYFKEYGKNIIENIVQDRFEVYESAAKRRNLNVLDYINCYINNINIDSNEYSIEQAKETIKNHVIKEIKAAYQNDNHYELPNVVVKKQYLTKDILSLYFEDKDKCIDTILDFVKEEYKENFNVYYSYEYVDKNQDALMKIKNDLIKLVDDYSIKSCNVELEFPDKSKVEFKFNMPQNRINYIKQQIINYDVLAIKTRHSYVKYPVESIKKITRYKQVLFDRNNYDAINYDKKQLIDVYSKCNIYTHFSNDFYEDKDLVKKLLYKQSSIISNLNEKLLMDEDFIEYLIRSYSHTLSLISCYTPEMVDKFIEVAKKENLAFNTIEPFLNVPGFELTNDKIKELFNISKQPEIDAEKILCKIPEAKFKDKDFINFLKNEKIIPLKPDYGHKFFDYIKDIDILFDVLHIKGMFNKVIHAPKFLNDREFMNYLLERADFEKINLKTHQILPIYQDDKDIIYKAAKVCNGEYCQEFYDALINIENEKKAARTPCAFELNEDMQIELMDSNINFIKNICINQNVKDIYIIGTMCGFNKIYKDAYSIFLETDQFKIIINKNHFVITDDKERVYTSPIDCDNINMVIDALIDEMHDREMSVKATNFESLLKELPDRNSLEKEI